MKIKQEFKLQDTHTNTNNTNKTSTSAKARWGVEEAIKNMYNRIVQDVSPATFSSIPQLKEKRMNKKKKQKKMNKLIKRNKKLKNADEKSLIIIQLNQKQKNT